MTADVGNRRSSWKALAAWAAIAVNVVGCVGLLALSFCPPGLSWLAWAGLISSLSTAAILARDLQPITSSAERDTTDRLSENRMLTFVIAAPVVATVAWLLLSLLWGA